MAAVAWSALTSDQKLTLLTSPLLDVQPGAERLDLALKFQEDISAALVVGGDDEVEWNGADTIHRSCTATLRQQLDWAHDLLRLYQTLTDSLSGLQVKQYIGTFSLSKPKKTIGSTPVTYTVTGQDRLKFLTRQVGYSYFLPMLDDDSNPVLVLDAIRQVFADAGLTGVLIDGTASDEVLPTDMTWPLVPSTTAATDSGAASALTPSDVGTSDDGTGPATWLRIINKLCELIGYRGVWADESGQYRIDPYIDPGSRAPSQVFDTRLTLDRAIYLPPAEFNEFVFINTTLPDVDDQPATPTEGAGVYTIPNPTEDLTCPTVLELAAVDQASLVALGDAQAAAVLRQVATADVDTRAFPAASHYDVFTWQDPDPDVIEWRVEATRWRLLLNGSRVEWSFTKVG